MPKGLPLRVKENLEKTRYAAVAAVDAYNRPGPQFRTAQFIVMIVIAWTALLHAVFFRRGTKPWYRARIKGVTTARYEKIDGEPKHWDLSECLKHYFKSANPPERQNLEFLIGLRNKIEHRHLPHIDPSVYGECQAALINLETLLVTEFGRKFALAEQLGIALQFSQLIPDEKSQAFKAAVKSSGAGVLDFVAAYRGGLSPTVLESMKYSFSVYLVPRIAGRANAADAAVQFVHIDETSPEGREQLQELTVLIREKQVPIVNLNHYRPQNVVEQVALGIPFKFAMHHHTAAWKFFKIRPSSDAKRKDKTDSKFCIHDKAHNDFLYTPAWVNHLISQLSTAARFKEVTGSAASEK